MFYPGVGGYTASLNDASIANYYNKLMADGEKPTAFLVLEDGAKNTHHIAIEAILEHISNQNNEQIQANINITDYSGHSAGGLTTIEEFNNYGSSTAGLTLYDPDNINKQKYEKWVNNPPNPKTEHIRFFAQDTTIQNKTFFIEAAKQAIPTLVIDNKSIKHAELVRKTTEDGWLLYFNGIIKLTDIKGSGYIITVPKVIKDENGKVIDVKWSEYSLDKIIKGMINIFNQDYFKSKEELYEFIDIIKHIESNRVTIDYDYLSEIANLKTYTTNLSELEYTALNCASSKALYKESDFMENKSKSLKDFGTNISSDISKIEDAKIEYKQLEEALVKNQEEIL